MGIVLVFTNAEYRIALVDFIVALRRTKGRRRRTLRSPSPPSSGLHLLTPGIRCGGALLLPRAWGNVGSCIQVQVDNRQFRILYSYLCSALYRSRFSRGAQLGTFVFHYWGRGCSFLRLRGGLLWSIVGITANREWNVNMADKREGKQNLIVPSPIWYGILPQHRKLYPALSPRRRRMTLVSRSRTIYVGNGSLTLGSKRICTNYIHIQSPS